MQKLLAVVVMALLVLAGAVALRSLATGAVGTTPTMAKIGGDPPPPFGLAKIGGDPPPPFGLAKIGGDPPPPFGGF